MTAANTGKYMAELRKGIIGCMKGQITFNEGWDAPLDDDILEEMLSMRGMEEYEVKNDTVQ